MLSYPFRSFRPFSLRRSGIVAWRGRNRLRLRLYFHTDNNYDDERRQSDCKSSALEMEERKVSLTDCTPHVLPFVFFDDSAQVADVNDCLIQ